MYMYINIYVFTHIHISRMKAAAGLLQRDGELNLRNLFSAGAKWPSHDIGNTNTNIVCWMATQGSRGEHHLNHDCKIRRGAKKKVSSANNRFDECTLPESTAESLGQAKEQGLSVFHIYVYSYLYILHEGRGKARMSRP